MYPSHDDWVYLAGLVDGEGSIVVHQSRRFWNPSLTASFAVRLQVTNTYEPVMRWLEELFGGRVYTSRKVVGRRQVFVWYINGQAAIPILRTIRPHLHIKATQAWLAMEAWEQRGDIRKGDNRAEVMALRSGFVLASSYSNRHGVA